MVSVRLNIPDRTYKAIQKFAELTGISNEDCVPHVIQDALRTYEWVLAQQAMGQVVAALEKPDLAVLKESTDVEGERKFLQTFLSEKKTPAARDYLWEETSDSDLIQNITPARPD